MEESIGILYLIRPFQGRGDSLIIGLTYCLHSWVPEISRPRTKGNEGVIAGLSIFSGIPFGLPPRDGQTRSWRVGDGPNTRKSVSLGEGWFIQYPQAKDASTCCNYTDFVCFIKSSWRFRWDIAGFSSHLGHSQPWGSQIERSPWQRCMSPSLHNQREQGKAEKNRLWEMTWGRWSFGLWWNCCQITFALQSVAKPCSFALTCRHLLQRLWPILECLDWYTSTVWQTRFFFVCFMHGWFGCTPWCMWCVNVFGQEGVWVGNPQECTRFSRKRTRRWRLCQNFCLRLESAETLSLEAIRVVGVGIWPVPFSAPLPSVPRALCSWLETCSYHLFVGHFSSLCRL